MASASPDPTAQIYCKGVLFDMDGILVSSLGSVERSWSKWAKLRGVDPELTCETAHGRRAIETIAIMRPDLDCEQELRVIEDIEIEDNEGLTVLPGVLAMLALLHSQTDAATLLLVCLNLAPVRVLQRPRVHAEKRCVVAQLRAA